jgi:hypothetical protein
MKHFLLTTYADRGRLDDVRGFGERTQVDSVMLHTYVGPELGS